jgi:hypothetical protein
MLLRIKVCGMSAKVQQQLAGDTILVHSIPPSPKVKVKVKVKFTL